MKSAGKQSQNTWRVVRSLFDARLFWEEESGKKGDRFNVNNMVGTGREAQHEMLLRRAQVLYSKLFGKPEQSQVSPECN